jgi:hypothetical protein
VTAGQPLRIEVPSYSIEFWTEEVGAMDTHGLLIPTRS